LSHLPYSGLETGRKGGKTEHNPRVGRGAIQKTLKNSNDLLFGNERGEGMSSPLVGGKVHRGKGQLGGSPLKHTWAGKEGGIFWGGRTPRENFNILRSGNLKYQTKGGEKGKGETGKIKREGDIHGASTSLLHSEKTSTS